MSTYSNNLKEVGMKLRDEGWDQRAAVVIHAANRIERMESLIVELMADPMIPPTCS